jgi:hypothetical protein
VTDIVVVQHDPFRPLECLEAQLEGLLKTAAPAVFPGFNYFDFKVEVPSVYGAAHPDAVLLSRETTEWWVIEVESHYHSIESHIEPQLKKLGSGQYGPSVLEYLERKVAGFMPDDYGHINSWEPHFLLIIDEETSVVRRIARRNGFEVLRATPYRSEENRYALLVAGHRPAVEVTVIPPGIDCSLDDISGIAVLMPATGRQALPELPEVVAVDNLALPPSRLADGRGFALPIRCADLVEMLGDAHTYRLSFQGRLFAVQTRREQ